METINNDHICLNDKELEEFRTKQCPLYIKGLCANSTRCNMSHSETWPRRNPSVYKYEYKLCPNIQFFRMDNKMQLHGKCHYGRKCRFSHSKEEQLYHPDLYKTRFCLNYPNCKGYYCPFVHEHDELRNLNKKINIKRKGRKNFDNISLNSTICSPYSSPLSNEYISSIKPEDDDEDDEYVVDGNLIDSYNETAFFDTRDDVTDQGINWESIFATTLKISDPNTHSWSNLFNDARVSNEFTSDQMPLPRITVSSPVSKVTSNVPPEVGIEDNSSDYISLKSRDTPGDCGCTPGDYLREVVEEINKEDPCDEMEVKEMTSSGGPSDKQHLTHFAPSGGCYPTLYCMENYKSNSICISSTSISSVDYNEMSMVEEDDNDWFETVIEAGLKLLCEEEEKESRCDDGKKTKYNLKSSYRNRSLLNF